MIAAGEALDLGQVLLDLLVILVAARVAAELAERIRVPAVLGEIVVGILIGPSVLGWIDTARTDTASMVLLLGEIGVLLLLLQVGMEMDLAELAKVGKAALLVAVIGVAIPFAGGALGAWGIGEVGKTAVFIGAALTATSVGITARVLGDLKALATTEARVVLGAAVADDVLGLIILTVVVKVVTDGSVGVGTVAETIGMAVGFLLVTGLIAVFVVPRALDAIHRWVRTPGTLLVAAIALMLAFAELADAAKLAFIIGAFMAGIGIGRSDHLHRIEDGITPLARLFVPVFFVSIGLNADLEAMARPSVLGLAAVLTLIGIVGKVVAGWGAVGARSDKLLIGIGMIPRGEVGLIFASIGLKEGVLDDDLYGALLLMVLASTVVAPPLLRWRIQSTGLIGRPTSSIAEILTRLVGGDHEARRDLVSHPDFVAVSPGVAHELDDAMPGHGLPLPTFDEIDTDDERLRRGALLVDLAADTDDATARRLAGHLFGAEADAVFAVVATTAVLRDIGDSPDGISDDEIRSVAAAAGRVEVLAMAAQLAAAPDAVELEQRAAIALAAERAVALLRT